MTATNNEKNTRKIVSKTSSSSNQFDNILEDGAGHINRDLAERIWNWEQHRRDENNLPKVDYSIRSGLRLVDDLVREALSQRNQRSQEPEDSNLYADLVQDGLAALLDAMSHYREEDHGDKSFEAYARKQIRRRIVHSLQVDVPQIRLPKAVKSVIREAKGLAQKIKEEKGGKDATLSEIAERLKIPQDRLKDYLRLARAGMLSMESTVEIFHPMLEDGTPEYRDQDEWEIREGLVLDDGKSLHKEELVEDFMDEMQQLEGDDEAWVHQEQVAGPLQDLIPDTDEPSPDDQALMEMIRHDLSEFLTSTLDDKEVQVVRLSFGLDSGQQMSEARVAKSLGIKSEQVSDLLSRALEKLRVAYKERYVEHYFDDDEPSSMVDSV